MYERILVPVDGSPTSDRGLQEAIGIAQYTGGILRIVHVIEDLSFSLAIDAYANYAGGWLSVLREDGAAILQQAMSAVLLAEVDADTVLNGSLSGPIHTLVMAEANRWRADLIVLGTHGRRGVGRLILGSGAESILRCSTVPVLLVHVPALAAAARPSDEAARLNLRAEELAML